jgi:NAD(P)H-dependent flavin oxidoreductase YrpB (nitropropane dioxygenase family)
VWTGSIWLTTTESDTSGIAMDKLLHATSTDTVRSRALTGKPARQLRTAWTEAWEAPDSPGTLPMPLQFILNSKAMRRVQRSGNRELTGMPVGQIVSRMNEIRPCKDVIYDMVEEYCRIAETLGQTVGLQTP